MFCAEAEGAYGAHKKEEARDGKRESEAPPPGLSGFAISSSFAAGHELGEEEEEEEEGGVFRRFFDRGEETRSITFISRHISPFDELIRLTTSCL